MTAAWSLGEIAALAVKAARGAGYEWGLAQEAGQAVHWLLERDFPGADALQIALVADASRDPTRCPISLGCAIFDGAVEADGFAAKNVVAPLLVLPFVCWTAERRKQALAFEWAGLVAEIGADGEVSRGVDAGCPDRADIRVSAGAGDVLAISKCHRARVTCATYVALSGYADRTYAPATEASRLSGAGAGLSDND